MFHVEKINLNYLKESIHKNIKTSVNKKENREHKNNKN